MIRHLLAPKSDFIMPILQTELGLTDEYIEWLLDFGAIYFDHTRTNKNLEIPTGSYLRIHTKPRRFPVHKFNWGNQIIHNATEFVIINKPSGVPTHATVDNLKENAAWQISQTLGESVMVTNRLDVATSGLILYAKTKDFQKKFNKALMAGLVEKQYQAEVEGTFTRLGVLTHFMESSNRLPKRLSIEPKEGWQNCALEVLDSKPGTFAQTSILKIRLITGRTHQIRTQLAFEGHPILGDKLYGSETTWITDEKINLTSIKLKFHVEKDYDFHI